MNNEFNNKVVLVTGASGNIGAGIARAFAASGAQVVVHGNTNVKALAQLAEELGRSCALTWQGKLATSAKSKELTQLCVDNYGKIDCLINNAGKFPIRPLVEMDENAWSDVLDANLTSAALLTAAVASVMPRGSAIVNIGSIEASGVLPGHSHYAASKAGLLALTRNSAHEIGPADITVNAVSPGLIERPSLLADWPQGVASWCAKTPLGRVGTAADVAAACLFLCGPHARWITGSNLVVDGGLQAATLL